MTPLRQRMLEDMQMRNLSRGTQMVYVRAVMQLSRHYRKSPDQLQREEIRGYLVYLAQQRRVAPSTYNQTRCALMFFYQVTIGVPVNSIRESARVFRHFLMIWRTAQ